MDKKKIPKLRFRGFEREWEEKRLGDVCSFKKGRYISKIDIAENGELECIRYGELYTHYQEQIDEVYSKTNLDIKNLVLSKPNDVIIPASGETAIDISTASCVLRGGIALSGDINIIRTKLNGVFFAYYLNSKKKNDIARLAQGISVIHLYSSLLARLELKLPKISEQTKIANFLTDVDKKIGQLSQKKKLMARYKKGMMQKLFSQQIRFKNNNGQDFPNWDEKKLREVTCLVKDGTHGTHTDSPDSKYLLLSAKNIKNGKITNDTQDRRIPEKEFREIFSRYSLKKNDLLLTIVGTIGRCALYNGDRKIAFQRSVAIFRFLKDINPCFMYYCFTTSGFQLELMKKKVISAQPGIYLGDLSKIKVGIPSLSEQTKIANFLSDIDRKIEQIEQALSAVKEFKKGLLQKMFL